MPTNESPQPTRADDAKKRRREYSVQNRQLQTRALRRLLRTRKREQRLEGVALGQPFVIGRDGERNEVIVKYESWITAE